MARYALVIGISRYDNFRNLDKAATDAAAIARLLEQHRYTVIRLPGKLVSENQWAIDPDKKLNAAELSTELKTFLRYRATRQEVVIYFAGHGFRAPDALNDEEVGYLAASDSTKDGQNAVQVDALNKLLGKSDLASLVMLLDCCYAGTLIEQRSLLQPTQGIISQKQNYCLIAACRDFERAREGEHHGIFTAAVLRGLSAENAANGDITSTDLFGFISRILQPSGQEVIHAGMGQSIPLVAYQPTQAARASEQRERAHLTTERPLAESCQAYALAQKLRTWFETLGYCFEGHEVWTEDTFEWIINIPVRRNRYDRVLVRGINGEVGLRDIAVLSQSVTQRRTDEGWLVATRRISRAARDEVKKTENETLDCYTLDELLDQDADFSGYLTWLEAEIQQREIENRYVPLACTKEEFDPETKQRMGVSHYGERDGWIDGYIDQWLDDPAKEHLSVLGEFGTGKTWFAFHYAWKGLQRYKDAQRRGVERPRLPLVIPLRDYAKAVSVESLFSEFFFRKHEIPIPGYTAFEQLNRMGKLLLIFDGFDEMAAKIDRQQMINNFWELAKVVVPGAKVILTCRTEHFPEAQEGRALLNAELQASTANLTGETPQFEVLELQKFTDNQIRQVLSFQTTPKTVEKVMSNPQLLDLARRPIMTELILEALPDIEAGKPVDMSRVYLYAVRRKMERDIKAERTFTSLADKLYFLCELSWEMLSTDKMSLNYRLFPDRIRKLFGAMVQEEKNLDHWHYDMMGQTMLIRNDDGDYTPAHRSLLEFFVAYKFAAEMGALSPDFLELAVNKLSNNLESNIRGQSWQTYFSNQLKNKDTSFDDEEQNLFVPESISYLTNTVGKHLFTKALLDMLTPMITSPEPLWKILSNMKQKTTNEVQYLAGNIATLIRHLDADLSDQDFSNIYLMGANLSNSNLQNSDFRNSKIVNCDFSNTNLTNTNFCFAEFKNTSWGEYGGIYCTDISPNKRVIAAGIQGLGVRIWETKSGKFLRELPMSDTIYSVKFSHSGSFLGAATRSGSIFVWDTEFYRLIHHSFHQNQAIESLCFDANDTTIFYTTSVGIEAINFISGKWHGLLNSDISQLNRVAFDKVNNRIVTANSEGQLGFLSWNGTGVNLIEVYQEHETSIRSIDVHPIQDNLIAVATGGKDKRISIRDLLTGESIASRVLDSTIFSVALCPINNQIAVSLHGQKILILQIPDLSVVFSLEKLHRENIREICYSSDGLLLLSASYDGQLILWSTDTYKSVLCLEGNGEQKRRIVCNGMTFKDASGLTEEYIRFFEDRGATVVSN